LHFQRSFTVKGENLMKKIGLSVLLASVLLLTCFLFVNAQTTAVLIVGGDRGTLELTLDTPPPSDELVYYTYSSTTQGERMTLSWVETCDGYTSTVLNTKEWYSFKLVDLIHENEVRSPFWVDVPNKETGWLARSEIQPTLEVLGDKPAPTLKVWGIWGDEPVRFWILGTEYETNVEWNRDPLASGTYTTTLDNSDSWDSFIVYSNPNAKVSSVNPYWQADPYKIGWVLRVSPQEFTSTFLYVPIVCHQ
jgi:hypothetical protein